MNSAIIVLTWNGGAEAIACLQRVRQLDPAPNTVVVVDNDSRDGTPDQVAALFPTFLLIRNPRNLGYAAGMNIGIRALLDQNPPPDIIILLNQDTLVDPGWLGAIIAPFADPAVGAVGCKIRYPDGTIQHAGLTLDWPLALPRHIGRDEPDHGQYDVPRYVNFVTFAAAALRSEALRQIGLFDEGYSPAYFEDADLCVRLRQAGYLIRYEPRATLVHREAMSQQDRLTHNALVHQGRLRFVLKTYTLDEITGPFAQAERDLIRYLEQPSEKRALRWAYDKTLADLPHIWLARRETDQAMSDAVQRLLLNLQHELSKSSYRRIAARLADIEDLVTNQPALLAACYTLLDAPPLRLDLSESFRINVDVHNIGRIAWRSAGAHPIRLGYLWINQSGERIAGL
ncbi:MAG: glycosyltransferase family 2 protein, partial [Roseiflexus sp.]|nr:glycosyltransferase family 2 protein [Roseiflexus sp.]